MPVVSGMERSAANGKVITGIGSAEGISDDLWQMNKVRFSTTCWIMHHVLSNEGYGVRSLQVFASLASPP